VFLSIRSLYHCFATSRRALIAYLGHTAHVGPSLDCEETMLCIKATVDWQKRRLDGFSWPLMLTATAAQLPLPLRPLSHGHLRSHAPREGVNVSLFLEETSLTLTSPTQINIYSRVRRAVNIIVNFHETRVINKRNFVELFDSMVDYAGKKRGWIIVVSWTTTSRLGIMH